MAQLWPSFQFEFFRDGMFAARLVGGLSSLIGAYVVLRGMSYIVHGLSHALVGGAGLNYVMAWNFYIDAGLWGFVAALSINQMGWSYRIGADFDKLVMSSALIGISTAAFGMYLSFLFNAPSGAAVVLVRALFFLTALPIRVGRPHRVGGATHTIFPEPTHDLFK